MFTLFSINVVPLQASWSGKGKSGGDRATQPPILQGLQTSGFDRARVFEYKSDKLEEAFVCRGSVGLKEKVNAYLDCKILLTESKYAQRTKQDSRRTPIVPHTRNPEKTGIDPSCSKLNKDPNLPWIVYPLVQGKDLFGYLSVDNHVTKVPLTPLGSENLRLFGTLATQAIAKNPQFAKAATKR